MLYSDALKECPKLKPIEDNKGWTYQDVKYDSGIEAWLESIKKGADGSLYEENNEEESE